MASTLEIALDPAQRKHVEAMLRNIPNGVPIVISRALNKVATPVRSKLVKDAAKLTGLKQKDIRKRNIFLSRAAYRKLQAAIYIRGHGIPVIRMKARQTRQGVKYKGPGGWKMIPGAFIVKMPTGHTGVFKRASSGTRRELREKAGRRYLTELPIKEQKAESLPDLVKISGSYDQAAALAAQKLPDEVANQINVLIEQHARKVPK